ncbi:MAG: MFS transporter [Oscillospiraceae bacterium]|jgi:OFA family oxalate/formate antiporter-like MFS transporter|nr:MFS transporter [Oscillospiraceae bacterium]
MTKKQSPIPSIIGCLIIQLCVGILYIWSVLRREFAASYHLADGSTLPAMVASYNLFAFVVGNFVGGIINDKKGAKFTALIGVVAFALGVGLTGLLTDGTVNLIILTYCVIGGLGSGIAYGACISCVQKWLPHRRGFASGLAVSAFGLSTVVFAPVSRWLMDTYRIHVVIDAVGNGGTTQELVDYRTVFLFLGIVFLLLGVLAWSLVKTPTQEYLDGLPKSAANAKVVSTTRNFTFAEAAKTVPFWCIFLYIFFINGTWNLTSPLIATLGETARGLTPAQAVFAVSFAAIPNCAGRLIMATVSDRIGRIPASIILCVLTLVGAVFMTFIAGVPYIITVAAIAFGYGGPSAINAAITTDFFGPKYSGTNYGVVMMGLGVSSIFFNFISNTLLHKDPIPTFIMGAATAVLAAVCMLVINRYLTKMKKEIA